MQGRQFFSRVDGVKDGAVRRDTETRCTEVRLAEERRPPVGRQHMNAAWRAHIDGIRKHGIGKDRADVTAPEDEEAV
jgi:hypothetical protein